MEIPLYLAMTASEFRQCRPLPTSIAWLSCLFSPYGRGISNIPKALPPGSLLILSDRTPICGHDPDLIFDTLNHALSGLSCNGLLLDFERSYNQEAANLAGKLATLPYPVAISAPYAEDLNCAVFVPAPQPNIALKDYLIPWDSREIWLEISNQPQMIAIKAEGIHAHTAEITEPLPHYDATLHCHYAIDITETAAIFTLQRTKKDWMELLDGNSSQITHAIGLHQEFANTGNQP